LKKFRQESDQPTLSRRTRSDKGVVVFTAAIPESKKLY